VSSEELPKTAVYDELRERCSRIPPGQLANQTVIFAADAMRDELLARVAELERDYVDVAAAASSVLEDNERLRWMLDELLDWYANQSEEWGGTAQSIKLQSVDDLARRYSAAHPDTQEGT